MHISSFPDYRSLLRLYKPILEHQSRILMPTSTSHKASMLEVIRRLHADKNALSAVADIITPISSESSQVVSQHHGFGQQPDYNQQPSTRHHRLRISALTTLSSEIRSLNMAF